MTSIWLRGSRISCGAACRTTNSSTSPLKGSSAEPRRFEPRWADAARPQVALLWPRILLAQWLETRKLKEFTPDPHLFPEFDESLRSAMLEETQALLRQSIQDDDRPVLDFLDADYTFVNERLARHYGMPGIVGDDFRRVSLTGTARGGVLTHASVLAATSNPTRTSPVKRGKWILENILGTPPPPPPSGVEALKEGTGPKIAGTLRDRLEHHRRDPSCASCHRRMDPLGFGLENFDAVGAWRTHDGSQPIDPSGKLPGGANFRGPGRTAGAASGSTRRVRPLLRREDAHLRTRSRPRTRRPPCRRPDRGEARGTERYRFSALVLAVVESEPFPTNPDHTGEPMMTRQRGSRAGPP